MSKVKLLFLLVQRTFASFWVILYRSPPNSIIGLSVWYMPTAVLAEVGLVKVTEADAVGIIFIHFFGNCDVIKKSARAAM